MTNLFLADENVPGSVVCALRAAGHDVAWIAETTPGSPDADVLANAMRDARVLVSFDKDFGELAQALRAPPCLGIILVRLRKPATVEAAQQLADIIGAHADWAGHFSVVEPGRVRMRRLFSA